MRGQAIDPFDTVCEIRHGRCDVRALPFLQFRAYFEYQVTVRLILRTGQFAQDLRSQRAAAAADLEYFSEPVLRNFPQLSRDASPEKRRHLGCSNEVACRRRVSCCRRCNSRGLAHTAQGP